MFHIGKTIFGIKLLSEKIVTVGTLSCTCRPRKTVFIDKLLGFQIFCNRLRLGKLVQSQDCPTQRAFLTTMSLPQEERRTAR